MKNSRRHIRLIGLVAELAAIQILAAPSARAAPALGEGMGTYTCAEFMQTARADREGDLLYFSWGQGWMTGWNLARMQASLPTADLNRLSVDEERVFIKDYCRDHPTGLYMDAVHQLYTSLNPADK